MATPAKQEILVKNLPTSHVILYPSRALVTRSIGNIVLQPGANQIEIYGITPTADEHSIKVDGTGAASITDMTVDLVPNRDSFQDVYPDESDSDQGESDDQDDATDSESDPVDLKTLRKEINDLSLRLERSRESVWVADKAMDLFNDYCAKVDAKEMKVADAQDLIDGYRERRLAKYDEIVEKRDEQRLLQKDIDKKERQLRLATKECRAEKRRADKQADKAREKKQRAEAEKAKARQRIREERLKFWPKKVFRVVIHLDASVDTPATSRRSSVGSAMELAQAPLSNPKPAEGESESRPVWLTLSYVTSDASWSPRYDMTFSTPNKNGSITYRAEYKNSTSETWKDAKVSLSTSQASFRGLDDEVPFMHPWHLGLTKTLFGQGADPPGLTSKEEQIHKQRKPGITSTAGPNRAELFGIPDHMPNPFQIKARKSGAKAARVAVLAESSSHAVSAPPPPAPSGGSIFANTVGDLAPQARWRGGGLFGSQQQTLSSPARFGGSSHAVLSKQEHEGTYESASGSLDADEAPAFIEFEDSTWEDHGLTQTYDLPGVRTLEPSSLTRRYKIATLPFTNLILTSIAVPKLRPASFLRARFRNPSSSITLLKGTAGLTLDGAFLGNTTLPRISPGELITLPLGVDPAVQVSYAKPTVKRSTQGVFNKEATQIFTRSIILTNSKPVAVELLVLDQVPVSEDEKLRIDLVQPKGLAREGDAVSTGVNAKQGKAEGEKWGKAKANLKNNGEVAWNVSLEKGGACRLTLEYEVKTPSSEGIVSK